MKGKLNASMVNNMNLEMIKMIGGTIAGLGTSTIVGTAVRNVVGNPKDMNLYYKVTVGLGTAMMGGLAAIKVNDYTQEWIEDMDTLIKDTKEEIEWLKTNRQKKKGQ